DSHGAGRPLDHPHGGLNARRVEVGELQLGDLANLLARDLADLLTVGRGGPLLEPRRPAQEHRRRRRLGDEGERPVRIDGDLHRDDKTGLALRPGVELLAELHDVHAVLTQRRPDGRRGVRSPGGNLEFDEADDLLSHVRSSASGRAHRPPPRGWTAVAARSVSLQLRVVELHRRRSAEEADLDLHLALVGVDLLDRTAEIGERTLRDLHDLADPERDLLPRLELLGLGREAEDLVHLLLTQRLRLLARAHELDHALDAVDQVRGPLVEDHLHEHIARVEAPGDRDPLAVPDLHDVLRGNDDVLDLLLLGRGPWLLGDATLDELLDLVLVARVRLDRVPPRLARHGSTREKIDDLPQDPAHRGVHEPDDQGDDED